MAMMGVQETPARLFYDFCLDEHVSITCSGASTVTWIWQISAIVEVVLQPHGPTPS
jgi:hypothetical protein